MNPFFLADFYKVGHPAQYSKDVQQIYSNWTPRYTHDKSRDSVVHFGLQYFIKRYLEAEFRGFFFDRPLSYVLNEYKNFVKATLGTEPNVDHLEKLWKLQYLPIEIYSLPEGTTAPLGIPSMVITNTVDGFGWLVGYLESMMSACLWKPSTSATKAQSYRNIFKHFAKSAGETDFSFVDWMGHDFSMRGMSGVEDVILSGMGHLLSFSGTDSMPAIIAADQYYRSGFAIGGSVPATEHSVMQAGSIEGEYETFLRLITEVYPTGILSIVSDTWDLWKVLTDYMPRLKDTIVARPGKIVIRPDSGDPVKIIVGDTEQMGHSGLAYGLPTHPSFYGVADLLRREFPTTKNAAGYDQLTNVGMIYGDSITLDRAKDILTGLLCKGFSPYNMVFGIGSFTYEYVTRDTYGFAMKATALKRKNQIIPIFKKPITDEGKNSKASMRGIPIVMPSDEFGFVATESIHPSDLDNCAYEKVYRNGDLLINNTFAEIRKRVRGE